MEENIYSSQLRSVKFISFLKGTVYMINLIICGGNVYNRELMSVAKNLQENRTKMNEVPLSEFTFTFEKYILILY